MKYLSFVLLLASSSAALASAVNEDMEISQHRDLEIGEQFRLILNSTHESFGPDKEWCLTAKRNGKGSLIHVRECEQLDGDQENSQLWETYENNQLKLSESNLCLRARDRRVFLNTCKEGTDYRNFFIFDKNSNVIEHEDDDGIIFLLGLRKSAAMGRLLLFQDNTRSVVDNDTLTWNLQYAHTASPTSSPVQGTGRNFALSSAPTTSPITAAANVPPNTVTKTEKKETKKKSKKKCKKNKKGKCKKKGKK